METRDQARAVARSASWTSSRRSGSGLRTRTSEPPRLRGSVKVAVPGGEAGSATDRRRPPSVRDLPTAAVRSSCSCGAGAKSCALGQRVGGEVVAGGRVPGGEAVRLAPDLDTDVEDAVGDGLGEAGAEGTQAAREHGDRRGAGRPGLERVGPAHHRVGVAARSSPAAPRSTRRRGRPWTASAAGGRCAATCRARGRPRRSAGRPPWPPSWRTSSPRARRARRWRGRRTSPAVARGRCAAAHRAPRRRCPSRTGRDARPQTALGSGESM